MPIRFRLDTTRGYVHAIGEEPLTDEDLRQYQLDLAADRDHGSGFHQLIDLRAVGGLNVTTTGIRMAGQLTQVFAEHVRGTRCALVVSGPVAYGMARMFEVHASDSLRCRVFQEIEAAMAWLDRSSAPPGVHAVDGDADPH